MEEITTIGNKVLPTQDSHESLVGQSMLATESDILLIGGHLEDGKLGYCGKLYFNRTSKENQSNAILGVYRYNFASGQWTEIATEGLPTTRIWSSLHLQGRQLFIYGGTGYPVGQMLSNNLKVLDLSLLDIPGGCLSGIQRGFPAWSLIETNASDYNCLDSGDNAPPRGYRQNTIFHGGSMYVFAGVKEDEYITDMHKLNFVTISWEKLTPTGKPPCQPAQFLGKDEERFYVIGNTENVKKTSLITKIWSYIFNKNHWEIINTIPDLEYGAPMLRHSFAVCHRGTDVILSGGFYHVDENVKATLYLGEEHDGLYFNDIWYISLETYQWHKLDPTLRFPTCEHSTVISPAGYLYVFGGKHKPGYFKVKCGLYKLQLSFLCRKLSELCWEKTFELLNQSPVLEKSKLRELGVPWSFFQRFH